MALPAGITPTKPNTGLPDGIDPTPAQVPPGVTPNAQPNPVQFTPLPQLHSDIDSIVQEKAKQYGIPGWALHTMAQIESGGQADPTHAVSGLGAKGVMQFTDDTWKDYGRGKSVFDAGANIDAGARYYKSLLDKYKGDTTVAAAAYNWGPGHVDNWLQGKEAMNPETAKYMARLQAAKTANDELPLPPAITPIKGINRQRNDDPTKAKYNLLETIGGHQDLPFILINAAAQDKVEGSGTKHWQEAWDLWHKNPGAAGAIYGLGSPNSLKQWATSSNQYVADTAKFLLAHPKADGAATFMLELANPLAWAEGGTLSRIARMGGGAIALGAKAIGAEEQLRYVTHIFSPWRDIVAAHGEPVRNHLATIGQQFSIAERKAQEHVQNIFEGLTKDEQIEVIRRQQNLAPYPHTDPKVDAKLTDRANQLRDLTRDYTARAYDISALHRKNIFGVQVPEGTKPIQLTVDGRSVGMPFDRDPGTYHPLQGQWEHPYGKDYNSVLDSLGYGKGAGQSFKAKKYGTIDEAMGSKTAPFDLANYEPADQVRKYFSAIGKRTAFEKGLIDLANSPYGKDVIKLGLSRPQRSALLSSSQGKWVSLDNDVLHGQLPETASANVKQAVVSPAFGKFLQEADSMSKFTGMSLVERGLSDNKLAQFWNKYNQAMRTLIIYNPAYHPFWNIATNHAATESSAIAAFPHMMNDYTRALLGTGAKVVDSLGGKYLAKNIDKVREGLEGHWHNGASRYQDALMEAERAGATAEFGGTKTALGGNVGRITTRKDLSGMEWIDRQLTRMAQWNKEATFGERGESAFAVTLFNRMKNQFGMDDHAAAWATREALGNYRNVDPESWMSKMMFFYPWLKSNVPFWFKTFLQHPTFATAPTMASRQQREAAGDPTVYDAQHASRSPSVYLGMDNETGERSKWAPPLPMKDAQAFAQSVVGLTDKTTPLSESITSTLGEFMNRAKPGIAAGANTALTAFNPRAEQPGTYQGFNTMYNRNADSTSQKQQLAASIGSEIAPVPAPFVAHDVARQLQRGQDVNFDSSHVKQYLVEALGAGYITRTQADSVTRQIKHLDNRLEKQSAALRRRQASAHPLTEDAAAALAQRYYQQYSGHMATIYDRVKAAQSRKTGSLPPGITALPEGITPSP